MRRKPKTRRHLRMDPPKVVMRMNFQKGIPEPFTLTAHGSFEGRVVNTGKSYSPQHIGHDAAGAFLTTDAAVASTRDIRGHGHSTSRVKRTRRQLMELWRGWRRSRPPEIHERLAAGAAE